MVCRTTFAKAALAAWAVLITYVGVTIALASQYNPKVLAEPSAPIPPPWALSVYDFMQPFWALNWLIVPVLFALAAFLTVLWLRTNKPSSFQDIAGSP